MRVLLPSQRHEVATKGSPGGRVGAGSTGCGPGYQRRSRELGSRHFRGNATISVGLNGGKMRPREKVRLAPCPSERQTKEPQWDLIDFL